MRKEAVLQHLDTLRKSTDPMKSIFATAIYDRIETDTVWGRSILDLLRMAERGAFR